MPATRRERALLLVALLAATSACAGARDASATRAPIVGGSVDDGDPAVYFVATAMGDCTAALISPHVVLTARHCLIAPGTDVVSDPATVRVYTGTGPSFDTHYLAAALYVVPGSTSAAIDSGAPDDLGLIVLTSAAAETPFTVDRGSPSDILGQPLTSIGYGLTPSGAGGVKRHVTTRVDSAAAGMFYTPPSVCPGDSGGPGIGPNGHIYGVAVLYTSIGPLICGTSIGGYNAIDVHRDWIDSVIQATGDACFPAPEICDGIDNDCNGIVDDGCPRACDPTSTSAACGDGQRCVRTTDCMGVCMPAVAGAAHDASCARDDECASGSCADPGDGRRRCLVLCRGSAGDCLSGETCTAGPDACGACVPEDIVVGLRGLGEECHVDFDCQSAHCAMRAGIGECVAPCDGTTCAAGFVCQSGSCVLDRRQPVGGPCIAASDCASDRCVTQGARAWCSVDDCTTTPCPSGFACMDAGGVHVCVPSLALPGEPCRATADCATGTCTDGECTTPCERAGDCGTGLRCIRDVDGLAARCLAPGVVGGGGCSVTSRGKTEASPMLIALCIVLLFRLGRPGQKRTVRMLG